MPSEQIHPRLLQIVQLASLRRSEEPTSRVELARPEARLHRCQRPIRTLCLVPGECHGALQKRRCDGEPTPRLRTRGGTFQL